MSAEHRALTRVVLLIIAAVAAVAAPVAMDNTACADTATIPTLFVVSGVVALIGAFVVGRTRIRWAILAAAIYAIVVYAVCAFIALGNCAWTS